MRRFKVTVEGRNVVIKLDERQTKMGFFATRLIEAEAVETAKQNAVRLIRAELNDVTYNTRADPPVLAVEEVLEINRRRRMTAP